GVSAGGLFQAAAYPGGVVSMSVLAGPGAAREGRDRAAGTRIASPARTLMDTPPPPRKRIRRPSWMRPRRREDRSGTLIASWLRTIALSERLPMNKGTNHGLATLVAAAFAAFAAFDTSAAELEDHARIRSLAEAHALEAARSLAPAGARLRAEAA